MATIENLKPIKSEEEAREKGRKGGIASGKARAERKALKEEVIRGRYTEKKKSIIDTAGIRW